MIIEGKVMQGKFVKRLNRFEAIVKIEGVEQLTHVPNTGRLKELLVNGASVIVRQFDNPKRKTKYGLLLVLKEGVWVSIDSANVPNKLISDALNQKKLTQFANYENIKREVTVGNSRFDFGLFCNEREYYIEVKGVTLVENKKAYFPDAPTVRGTKHLLELTEMVRKGKGAGVIFVIQREDADSIRPNKRTDMEFSTALKEAYQAGVDIWAYRCIVKREIIALDKEIPVILEK